MRVLLKANMSTAAANAAVKRGKLGPTLQSILDDLKPEAAYFTAEKGQRTAYLVLDIQDVSELTKIAEPWFLAFDAAVEVSPLMTAKDVAKAGPFIGQAAKKYG
jgi:hypothetical protein